jgi:hypothetical protein
MTHQELFNRAVRAYRSHSGTLCKSWAAAPTFDTSAVGPVGEDGITPIILRTADGRYLGLCRYRKRVNYISTCIDCRTPDLDWYMVADEVWAGQAGYRRDETACLDCLEKRLGRGLTVADFTGAPINIQHLEPDGVPVAELIEYVATHHADAVFRFIAEREKTGHKG